MSKQNKGTAAPKKHTIKAATPLQELIPQQPPTATEPELLAQLPELAPQEYTDEDVLRLYKVQNLGSRAVADMTTNELAIMARFGQLAQQETATAQNKGRLAEIEIVRKQLDALELEYAVLQLAEEAIPVTLQDLNNKRVPTMPITVTIAVAGQQVVITQELLKQYAPADNAGQSALAAALKQAIGTVKRAIMTNQSKINNGSGKAYNLPFNFQAKFADIKNTHLAHGE